MRICKVCGHEHNRPAPLCQRCYIYSKGPHKGVLYDCDVAPNGDPVCKVCGQAHVKLGNHIFQVHKMTTLEYLDLFSLPHNTRLTSKTYQDKMRGYIEDHYDVVVKNNLLINGQDTRYVFRDKRLINNKHPRWYNRVVICENCDVPAREVIRFVEQYPRYYNLKLTMTYNGEFYYVSVSVEDKTIYVRRNIND